MSADVQTDKRIENEEKYDAHHDQTPTWNHNAFPFPSSPGCAFRPNRTLVYV